MSTADEAHLNLTLESFLPNGVTDVQDKYAAAQSGTCPRFAKVELEFKSGFQ